ncbi:arouser isoform X2 [Brevipalpus obovatus]|uniref:arouser isoform X2 n=1 Tax=Brevipalpus obovatus TaxID=246614 RepID=UPI003D9EB3F5
MSKMHSNANDINYVVEHLATFSTSIPAPITPKTAIQRLFTLEKTAGIWTQQMILKITDDHMLIVDSESDSIVEKFPVTFIQRPVSFSPRDHLYDNILIFTVQHPDENQGELHIFQCISHSSQKIVDSISSWMKKHGNLAITVETLHHESEPVPPNVHVKETVNAFNALAAQREKKAPSPVPNSPPRGSSPAHIPRDHDSRSVTTASSIESNHNVPPRRAEPALSNEKYVSILNHCFDDIERFIQRLQHTAAAIRELQMRNQKRGGKGAAHGGDGLLSMRARGPRQGDFFDILAKFKLAFNLLAKLKGCIHDPNAPELVHFLFTPLAIIIESARMNEPTPIDPADVGIPHLSLEAIELLSNCCTSKETELWQSLGPNWTRPHPRPPRDGKFYQPIFSDNWAPPITERDLMGFVSSSETSDDEDESRLSQSIHRGSPVRMDGPEYSRHSAHFVPSEIDDRHEHRRMSSKNMHRPRHQPASPADSTERDSPVSHLNEAEQLEWLGELQSRGVRIVQVLFPRTANNEKELTVEKGEILEILDDSRNWWKARNSRGQIAHVPNTIVELINDGYDFHRERAEHLARGCSDDWIRKERQGKKGEFRYF